MAQNGHKSNIGSCYCFFTQYAIVWQNIVGTMFRKQLYQNEVINFKTEGIERGFCFLNIKI